MRSKESILKLRFLKCMKNEFLVQNLNFNFALKLKNKKLLLDFKSR